MGKKQSLLTVVLAVVAGFVGGVGSSWFLMGSLAFAQKTPEPAKVIQAEKFEVVDKDGKVLATLGIGEGGEPFLGLSDKDEKLRTLLNVFNGEPHLALLDKDDKAHAVLLLDHGEPFLGLSGKDGKAKAQLYPSDLMLVDQNGKRRAWLTLLNGAPILALNDKDEKLHAVLGYTVERRSPASLVLFGEDGKVIWEAP